jgi:hypothetical protein
MPASVCSTEIGTTLHALSATRESEGEAISLKDQKSVDRGLKAFASTLSDHSYSVLCPCAHEFLRISQLLLLGPQILEGPSTSSA